MMAESSESCSLDASVYDDDEAYLGLISPTRFDVVVLGTSTPMSLLAASLSSSASSFGGLGHGGHFSVLQLDSASFYGGFDASRSIKEWCSSREMLRDGGRGGGDMGELGIVHLQVEKPGCKADLQESEATHHTPGEPPSGACVSEEEEEEKWSRILVDAGAPRNAHAAGAMVRALARSQAGRHTEFQLNDAVLCLGEDGKFVKVPFSRADVFTSAAMPAADKRALMRALAPLARGSRGALGGEDGAGPQCQPAAPTQAPDASVRGDDSSSSSPVSAAAFREHAERAYGMRRTLADALTYAVALAPHAGVPPPNAPDCHSLARRFLHSSGAFGEGTSPLLVPLYGSAEVAMALSRMAAVKGAIQVLRRGVSQVDDGGITTTTGQRIECRSVILPASKLSELVTSAADCVACTHVARSAHLLDAPLSFEGSAGVSGNRILAVYPPSEAYTDAPLFLEQRQHRERGCLYWTVYMSTVLPSPLDASARDASFDAMRRALRVASGGALFPADGDSARHRSVDDDSAAPRRLWSAWYVQESYTASSSTTDFLPSNVTVVDDANASPHFENACTSASVALLRVLETLGGSVDTSETAVDEDGDVSAEQTAARLFRAVADPDVDTLSDPVDSAAEKSDAADGKRAYELADYDDFGDIDLLEAADALLADS